MAKAFAKLTRMAIRKLAAGKKLNEHGILSSASPPVNGRRIHRVIGKKSDSTTRTQVEEFIEKVRQDAKHDRLSLPKGRKVALSFSEAVSKYLVKLDEKGGRDLVMKRRGFSLHLVPLFGNLPLSKINSFEVERYKKWRLQEIAIPGGMKQRPKDQAKLKTTSPSTVNRELAALSHLFSKVIENPAWLHRNYKNNKKLCLTKRY